MKKSTASIVFLFTALSSGAAASAQESSPLAKLTDTVAPSIVTVRVVAEIAMPAEMGGEKHEMKEETLGTIVDKSGLVMVPTSALDPGAQMGMMFGEDAEVESTVTSLKVVIGNEAKELVGVVVAKDEKLGFSFIKISDLGDRQLVPLAFGQGGTVDIGTTVYAVRRLAEAYDFAPFLARHEVAGRIKKPRNAWLLGESLETCSPVFTADGALCGVVAHIEVAGGNDREMSMMSMFRGGHGGRSFLVSPQVAANSIAQALEAAAKAPAKPADEKGGAGK